MIYCSFSCKTKYDEAAVYLKAVLYTSHYYLWQHEIVSGRLSFRGLQLSMSKCLLEQSQVSQIYMINCSAVFCLLVFFMFQCNPYTDIEHKIDFSCIVTTLWLTSLSVIRKLWAIFLSYIYESALYENVNRRTIEMLLCIRIFKASDQLKFHNATW